MTSIAPTLPLSGGTRMPQIALGTWPLDDHEVEKALLSAIEVGYRHVDTAENYENERGVGRALAACGMPRAELFVTTKINAKWHGHAEAAEGLARNLDRLGLDYVDLLLLHWPNPARDRYVHGWEGLIELRERGLARAIGVSNFKPKHLRRVIDATHVTPEVNQIERHPYLIRSAAVAFHAEHGIVTEGWSPLGRDNGLLEHPVVTVIAAEIGRSPSQVLLRWAVQQGHAVAVKSKSRERQADNLAVFDFTLSDGQLAALDGLDTGEHNAVDSDVFGH